jgi:hypothetical protein
MTSRQRRLKAIELTLTPQQIVLVWLRSALQAGTYEDGSQLTPPAREAVAIAVQKSVLTSLKGQEESLVERAGLQARQEADFLYMLVTNTNGEVLRSSIQRGREHLFLLGYLSAEMNGDMTKDRIESLRLALLIFIEDVIIVDAAVGQIADNRMNGEPILFRDCAAKLQEQLQMAEELSEAFNFVARQADVAEINMEELRNDLCSEADRWPEQLGRLHYSNQNEALHVEWRIDGLGERKGLADNSRNDGGLATEG